MMVLRDPDLLRQLMRGRNLTQQALAEAVTFDDGRHPTQQWISSLCAGRHHTTRAAAEQIATTLGIDADHLFVPAGTHSVKDSPRAMRTPARRATRRTASK